MERIDFFLAPPAACFASCADDVGGLPRTDCQSHEHGADGHGKDDECDRLSSNWMEGLVRTATDRIQLGA